MAVKHSLIISFALSLGLLSVTRAVNTRRFPVNPRLNVGAPGEFLNFTATRQSRLNVGATEEVGNPKNLVKNQIDPIAATETVKSTGESDHGLNVIPPEDSGQPTESAVINFGPKTDNQIWENKVLSDSGLHLGVLGNLELVDLFEGDIILTSNPAMDWKTRKAVVFPWKLWPKISGIPTVFYTIGNTKVPTSMIQEAIAHYEEHTCIRFKKTIGVFPTGYQIVFKTGGKGNCSSDIGRQVLNYFGGQDVILAEDCNSLSVVIHEIGHAVGLYHEQSRSDRDAYIEVIPANIVRGKERNFNKACTRNYETTYDFFSVMHYGPLYFSSNGDTTLSSRDPMTQGLMMISRSVLSFMDKLILNRLYGCVDQWVSRCSGISSDPCKNLGYLGPDCKCVCPPGTLGANCQTKTKSYTDALIEELLPLNERVTSPGTVSSPSYPTPQLPSVVFTKIITASTCQVVKLTVIGFDLFQRYSSRSCSSEGVEIRLGDPVKSGKWYCGSELKAGDTFQSEKNTLVLFYSKVKMTSNTNAGFSFGVTFLPDSSCR